MTILMRVERGKGNLGISQNKADHYGKKTYTLYSISYFISAALNPALYSTESKEILLHLLLFGMGGYTELRFFTKCDQS